MSELSSAASDQPLIRLAIWRMDWPARAEPWAICSVELRHFIGVFAERAGRPDGGVR